MYALAIKSRVMAPDCRVQTATLPVCYLASGQEAEVLAFLTKRPLHTVIMAGLIRDNGLVSSLNRGTFYACRGAGGRLDGVALIGHVTMIETQSSAALECFAQIAQRHQPAHVILGEQEKVRRFWHFYSPSGQTPRLLCRELLFELRQAPERQEPVDLRRATLEDIEIIVPVHAQMAFDECGINPLSRDPEGFRQRVAHRIERGRIWVWIANEKLIFKADVQSQTPEQIYLEGVYTSPDERGKGYGFRCISQLSRTLLTNARSLSVLVNEQNRAGQLFYHKAGYKIRGYYDTIYLQTQN
jgi:predicted GNAT family acetyltransferase